MRAVLPLWKVIRWRPHAGELETGPARARFFSARANTSRDAARARLTPPPLTYRHIRYVDLRDVRAPFGFARFVGARCRETNCREKTKRHRQRQDAARLSLCPVGAGGPQFCPRLPARTDAGGDAAPRRLLREIHDRLRKGISALLVRARQARRRQTRLRAELFRCRCQPAAVGMAQERAGSIRTIRAAGSNGIAAIIWAAACPKRTHARSSAGKPSAGMSARSSGIANRAISPAASASARRCCTGPTTAGKFDGAGGLCPLQSVIGARGQFTKYCQLRYRATR